MTTHIKEQNSGGSGLRPIMAHVNARFTEVNPPFIKYFHWNINCFDIFEHREKLYMITQVTSGVKVSVEVFYRPDQSNIQLNQHIFAYRITITNNSDYSLRLARRHWFIIDSNGTNREVEGEGVVGEQPIIGTGESYQYVSGCNLDSDIGKMYGTYLMERLIDKKQFYVRIPEFQMIVPYKLN